VEKASQDEEHSQDKHSNAKNSRGEGFLMEGLQRIHSISG
jgi:hypothetical protein